MPELKPCLFMTPLNPLPTDLALIDTSCPARNIALAWGLPQASMPCCAMPCCEDPATYAAGSMLRPRHAQSCGRARRLLCLLRYRTTRSAELRHALRSVVLPLTSRIVTGTTPPLPRDILVMPTLTPSMMLTLMLGYGITRIATPAGTSALMSSSAVLAVGQGMCMSLL